VVVRVQLVTQPQLLALQTEAVAVALVAGVTARLLARLVVLEL
jgi:hypothetical protein